MDQKIWDLLKSKPLQSLPVLGFFRNYDLDKAVRQGEFLLMVGTSDYPWAYLCGDNPEELYVLLEKFDYATLYFANVEEWMLPILTQRRKIEWKLSTHRYYLPPEKVVDPPDVESRRLDPSLAGYVFENSAYKDFTSEMYIRDRLDMDVSAGIWIDNKLVGWGLTHDDTSLGFLNVLPEYRGKGLGESILRALILEKRKMDSNIFVNIEPHNHQSINLIKKLGFSYDREVSWIKLT